MTCSVQFTSTYSTYIVGMYIISIVIYDGCQKGAAKEFIGNDLEMLFLGLSRKIRVGFAKEIFIFLKTGCFGMKDHES